MSQNCIVRISSLQFGLDLIEQIRGNYETENKMHCKFHAGSLLDINGYFWYRSILTREKHYCGMQVLVIGNIYIYIYLSIGVQ